MLERLMQSIWISRIGWTLIHTLWQFALVALAAFVVQRALRRRSAAIQYWALLAAMTVMVAAPLATCFLVSSAEPPAMAAKVVPAAIPEKATPSQPADEH